MTFFDPRRMTGAVALLALVLFLLIGLLPSGPEPAPGRAADALRRRGLRLGAAVERLEGAAGAVEGMSPERARTAMMDVAATLREVFRAEMAREEEILFPVVERKAGAPQITAGFRREHETFARWVEELEELASRPMPEGGLFRDRTMQALGLLRAHAEAEDAVLWAVIDRGMTPEQFRREVGSRMGID